MAVSALIAREDNYLKVQGLRGASLGGQPLSETPLIDSWFGVSVPHFFGAPLGTLRIQPLRNRTRSLGPRVSAREGAA